MELTRSLTGFGIRNSLLQQHPALEAAADRVAEPQCAATEVHCPPTRHVHFQVIDVTRRCVLVTHFQGKTRRF
jgi:hypothetical protein